MTGPGCSKILWKVRLLLSTMSGVVEELLLMNVGKCGPRCLAVSRSIKVFNPVPTGLRLLCPKLLCLALMSPRK